MYMFVANMHIIYVACSVIGVHEMHDPVCLPYPTLTLGVPHNHTVLTFGMLKLTLFLTYLLSRTSVSAMSVHHFQTLYCHKLPKGHRKHIMSSYNTCSTPHTFKSL